MATITLRPAGAGDKSEIESNGHYTGAVSVMAALNDNSDTSYAYLEFNDLIGVTSLYTLEAHGLDAGTTIDSVKLYYRGGNPSGYGNQYYKGVYKRDADASETLSEVFHDSYYTTRNLTIPAPDGGWTLGELENLQIGAYLHGNDSDETEPRMTDIWAVVDYTPSTGDAPANSLFWANI